MKPRKPSFGGAERGFPGEASLKENSPQSRQLEVGDLYTISFHISPVGKAGGDGGDGSDGARGAVAIVDGITRNQPVFHSDTNVVCAAAAECDTDTDTLPII